MFDNQLYARFILPVELEDLSTGTYTIEGTVKDIAGNSTTVTYEVEVVEFPKITGVQLSPSGDSLVDGVVFKDGEHSIAWTSERGYNTLAKTGIQLLDADGNWSEPVYASWYTQGQPVSFMVNQGLVWISWVTPKLALSSGTYQIRFIAEDSLGNRTEHPNENTDPDGYKIIVQ